MRRPLRLLKAASALPSLTSTTESAKQSLTLKARLLPELMPLRSTLLTTSLVMDLLALRRELPLALVLIKILPLALALVLRRELPLALVLRKILPLALALVLRRELPLVLVLKVTLPLILILALQLIHNLQPIVILEQLTMWMTQAVMMIPVTLILMMIQHFIVSRCSLTTGIWYHNMIIQ